MDRDRAVKLPFIMTLGEFREKTKNLADDTVLVAEMEEEFKFNEMQIKHIFDPVLDHPAVIWLDGSQVVNAELDMDIRLDVYLDL